MASHSELASGEKQALLPVVEQDISPPEFTRVEKRRVRCKKFAKLLFLALIGYSLFLWSNGTIPCAMNRLRDSWSGRDGHGWPADCRDMHSAEFSYDFDSLSKWDFEEVIKMEHGHHRYLHSCIELQPASSDDSHDVSVRITVKSNKEDILELPESQQSDEGLKFEVKVPRGSHDTCIDINAQIFVKPGIELSNLNIFSNLASLHMLPGLEEVKIESTNIKLDVGSLHAEPLSSRETRIETGAGSVRGAFNLYDLLSIHSHAGSVHVDVNPKDADGKKSHPAKLLVESQAGSVDIKYPPEGSDIPKRKYETFVSTVSGSIRGNYIHGATTELKTRSGSIAADILPYAADSDSTALHTYSAHGSQRINLRSPYTNAGTAIKRLTSSHITESGSLRIAYPGEWEGKLEGDSKVGRVTVRGDGVRIIEQGRHGYVGGWVKAEKGDGDSDLRFSSTSGSITVEVGH